MAQAWKKGRGKLGPMAPLLGRWTATTEQNGFAVTCLRAYQPFGDGWVRLEAEWRFGPPKKGSKATEAQKAAMSAYASRTYRETCFFGPDKDGVLTFWSYTNDGKRSSGKLSEAADIHPQAVCFEAQMDMGLARQVFWPADSGGMHWVVEAKLKKGWRRIADHHYRPA